MRCMPAWLPWVHSALETSPPPLRPHQALEREHREVRGKTKVHLPNRLIPGLGGERMMLQDLGVPEITFQRATSSEPARSRHAVCQLHCLRCATHGVGHGKQQVCSLV